jgi:hypothetical protein
MTGLTDGRTLEVGIKLKRHAVRCAVFEQVCIVHDRFWLLGHAVKELITGVDGAAVDCSCIPS